jgi:ribosomal protein S18 acetylase RimI-like enzyme
VAIEIRPAVEEDWRTLREIRFAALRDTPSAFGSTLAREEQYTEEDWRRWIGQSRMGDQQIIYLAFEGERCLGVVGAFDQEGRLVRLISMWVAPEARRRGLGRRLVDEVLHWTRSIGRDVVELHVTEGNAAAEGLYRQMGFQPTDKTMPLPSDPAYQLRLMRLRLKSNALSSEHQGVAKRRRPPA